MHPLRGNAPPADLSPHRLQSLAVTMAGLLPESEHTPPTIRPSHPVYAQRIAFDVALTLASVDRPLEDVAVLDLGGGFGLFSLVIAALGARSIIADDFLHSDPAHVQKLFAVFERNGVEWVQQDLLHDPLKVDPGLDAVTNFHFMEHLHSSPRRLFQDAKTLLRPGGSFVLAGPNAVNLRKRMSVPFGRGKWSSLESWYSSTEFRGHVREPDVDDLVTIVEDLGYTTHSVYGRNYLGISHGGWRGAAAGLVDPLLRHRPSLCSDIYIVAR